MLPLVDSASAEYFGVRVPLSSISFLWAPLQRLHKISIQIDQFHYCFVSCLLLLFFPEPNLPTSFPSWFYVIRTYVCPFSLSLSLLQPNFCELLWFSVISCGLRSGSVRQTPEAAILKEWISKEKIVFTRTPPQKCAVARNWKENLDEPCS